MSTLTLVGVDKVFSGGFHAVRNIDLHVEDGELLVLVGPSGCGKSTALRIIAGLESPSSGNVLIDGRSVTDLAPQHRNLAMVFQEFALYPHMTVAQNIAFPLWRERLHHREVDQRVNVVARTLHLTDVLDHRPSQLSGGQRQRVAMARAIIRQQPAAFLMDEPLSNLDAKLRSETRTHIARLHARLATTTVYVTHDQAEAMTLGSRVAVMRDGRIEQMGAPGELYDDPANVFVASFVGSPSMNLYCATMTGRVVTIGAQQLTVPVSTLERRRGLRHAAGRPVTVGIRPEDLHDKGHPQPPDATAMLRGEVAFVEDLGNELLVHFTLDSPREDITNDTRQSFGRPLSVARLDRTSSPNIFAPLDMWVDVERLHFFDPDSGASI